MPTYDYLCSSCGNRFELFQKMSDEPRADCPSCGAPGKRLFSAGGGFIMKGTAGNTQAPCGSESTCCGRGEPCGNSNGCHS